jgi:hypothetical protein
MEHSGSTLLTFLLNAHPEIFTVGEVKVAFDILPTRWQTRRGRCSCGKRFFSCNFWQSVLAGMAVRGWGLDALDVFNHDPSEKENAHQKLGAFTDAVLDVSNTTVFVDASKKTEFIQPLIENPWIELKILNLIRDGRGVVNSWRKNNPEAPFPKLIRNWIFKEKERADLLRTVPKAKVLSFKYEDLCKKPHKVLSKVFSFVGVQPDFDVTQNFKSAVEHHIVGNPMRLSGDETIRLDEKWRGELSRVDLQVFRALRGNAQNRKNGYWR